MYHKRFLYIEKVQVLATAGLLLAGVYVLLWRPFQPADPLGPTTMLATGHVGRFVLLALLLWTLTAIAAATTTFSRPEGALVAGLIAVGGLSLRSASIQPLLWETQRSSAGLYAGMAAEMLAFAILLLGAEAVVILVRSAAGLLIPRWLWQNPLGKLDSRQREILTDANGGDDTPIVLSLDFSVGPLPLLNRRGEQSLPTLAEWKQAALCCGTGVLAAIILLVILMASDDRGQVLFAVLASFVLAGMLGQQLFPTRLAIAAWAMPIAVAMLFYILAMVSVSRGGPPRPQFQVLPIDWLTAGCGGALLGAWLGERMRETRIFETLESLDELNNDA